MIAPRLLAWFDEHGRHDLPWQHPRSAYRVWIAEVMLQQTQVATVVPYFRRFMHALPGLADLAEATEDQVMALWSGLGYYRRARHAHQAARLCVQEHGGQLPRDFDTLLALPGIGRSTAGAILAQACDERHAILDGNVKRVLVRYHGIRGYPENAAVQRQLWDLALRHTPHARVADYTQAIMDLGATVCTRHKPHCAACPLADRCVALREDVVAQLPERKPASPLPQRYTVMLLLVDRAGRVLLERRGPQGVWAGLWSLPESHGDDPVMDAARLARVREPRTLAPFMHTFSHYRLAVTPVVFHATAIAQGVGDGDDTRWCARGELDGLGIPTPVRKLLESYMQEPLATPGQTVRTGQGQ